MKHITFTFSNVVVLIVCIIALFFAVTLMSGGEKPGTTSTPKTYYCGDGICNNGESCSSCSSDCGSCPAPTPYCGDGICNNGETCATCPSDCGTCPTQTPSQNSSFSYYENVEPYYSTYCDKINPYDLSVREAAADAIRNHPGSYNVNQLFDIYDWVKQNIIYQNVPLSGIPYPPSETLTTKSGDCKNQAVLIASMIESIGGRAEVVINPSCEHAYAIVYFNSSGSSVSWFANAVANHYGSYVYVSYITFNNGIWVYFDPAGGIYPGNLLEGCSGNTVYFVKSCLDCVNQYPDKPYTYSGYCYSQCPSGTIKGNQYSCHS